jgi:hypothetical protein
MSRSRSESQGPMTLGGAVKAKLRLIVWCNACRYQVEPEWRAKRSGMVPIYPYRNGRAGSNAPRAAILTWVLSSSGSLLDDEVELANIERGRGRGNGRA